MFGYQYADANEMLAITGENDDVLLCRSFFVWPWQKCVKFDIDPYLFQVDVDALSSEAIPLSVSANATIGVQPKDDKMVMRYVRLMITTKDELKQEEHIRKLITPILRGELRALVSSVSANDLVNNRALLLERLDEYLDKSLQPFGMTMYNCNFQQISDQSGYYNNQSKGTTAQATANAQISTADSKATAEIASSERNAQSTMQTSKMRADQQIYENQRQETVIESQSQLKIKEILYRQEVSVSQVENEMNAKLKQSDLQRALQQSNYQVMLERLRATELAEIQVKCEGIRKLVDSDAYRIVTEADAKLYQAKKEADGLYFAKIREAQGVETIYNAQAEGIKNLMESFHDGEAVLNYIMAEKGTLVKLASINAELMQKLQENTTFVQLPGSGDAKTDQIMQSLPPMIDAIHEQTGINLPEWLTNLLGADKKADEEKQDGAVEAKKGADSESVQVKIKAEISGQTNSTEPITVKLESFDAMDNVKKLMKGKQQVRFQAKNTLQNAKAKKIESAVQDINVSQLLAQRSDDFQEGAIAPIDGKLLQKSFSPFKNDCSGLNVDVVQKQENALKVQDATVGQNELKNASSVLKDIQMRGPVQKNMQFQPKFVANTNLGFNAQQTQPLTQNMPQGTKAQSGSTQNMQVTVSPVGGGNNAVLQMPEPDLSFLKAQSMPLKNVPPPTSLDSDTLPLSQVQAAAVADNEVLADVRNRIEDDKPLAVVQQDSDSEYSDD